MLHRSSFAPIVEVALASALIASSGCGPRPSHEAIIARCVEVAPNPRGGDAGYGAFIDECLLAYVQQPACRDALSRSKTMEPAPRTTLIATSCAAGYCPSLADPKPEICTTPPEGLSAREVGRAFEPLLLRIDALELGETDGRALEARLKARLQADVAAPPVDAAP